MRVVGAVLESLEDEVKSAVPIGPDSFKVLLKPSATYPRNDFRETEGRVWGDRDLLTRLSTPIEITLSPEGTVARAILDLHDYRPYVPFKGDRSLDVTIDATLAPTDEPLDIHPPRCQAIE